MNTKELNQHCYGELGDDRGYRDLPSHTFWEFSFLIFPYTEYFCTVWDEKDDRIIQFIAYSFRDFRYEDTFCGDIHVCEWVVKDDGLYVHNVHDSTPYIQNWGKRSLNGISPQASSQETELSTTHAFITSPFSTSAPDLNRLSSPRVTCPFNHHISI
ncbi:hypothetical protein ACFE04_010390 [Oxalis oulophora]